MTKVAVGKYVPTDQIIHLFSSVTVITAKGMPQCEFVFSVLFFSSRNVFQKLEEENCKAYFGMLKL